MMGDTVFGRPTEARTRWGVMAVLFAVALISVALKAEVPWLSTVLLLAVAALGLGAAAGDRVLGIGLLVAAAALDTGGLIAESGALRFTIYQVMAAGMLVVVLARMRSERAGVVRTPMDIPVIVFLAASALSILWAGDRVAGIVQLARLVSSAALAFMVVQVIRDERRARVLVWTMLALAATLSVLAVLEWADVFALQYPVIETPGYGIRARVTFHDPNIFGSFLVTAVLLALPFSLTIDRVRPRIVASLGIVVAIAGLVVTYSRGALGALLVGLLAAVSLSRIRARTRLAVLGGLAVVLLVGAIFAIDAAWIERNVIDLGNNESVMGRVRVAEGALRMWKDAPLGIGLGNFPLVYPLYQDPELGGVIESHTTYATVLAEAGVLGIAAFLWLLWRFFRRTAGPVLRLPSHPVVRALSVGALAAGAALCIQSFTYSLEASKFLWLTFGLGAAAWAMANTDDGLDAMLRPGPPASHATTDSRTRG